MALVGKRRGTFCQRSRWVPSWPSCPRQSARSAGDRQPTAPIGPAWPKGNGHSFLTPAAELYIKPGRNQCISCQARPLRGGHAEPFFFAVHVISLDGTFG